MDPEPGAAAPVGPCLGLGVPLLARQKPGVWGEEVARLALPAHWGQAPELVGGPKSVQGLREMLRCPTSEGL